MTGLRDMRRPVRAMVGWVLCVWFLGATAALLDACCILAQGMEDESRAAGGHHVHGGHSQQPAGEGHHAPDGHPCPNADGLAHKPAVMPFAPAEFEVPPLNLVANIEAERDLRLGTAIVIPAPARRTRGDPPVYLSTQRLRI